MNTQTTMICVGNHLAIYVMSSSVDSGQSLIRKWRMHPLVAPGFRQIWPAAAGAIRWPPESVLTPYAVYVTANVFFDSIRFTMLQQTAGMR
jgi:hypothetical protein